MTKAKKIGEYRNLAPMENRPGLWQFEIKTKNGWVLMTNLGGETDEDRKSFAQNTANRWAKK